MSPGGGEHGAYGAGLLTGWAKAGLRPELTIVSGVRTGALMAPFVSLGSAHYRQLEARASPAVRATSSSNAGCSIFPATMPRRASNHCSV